MNDSSSLDARARDAAIWQERCRLYCFPTLRTALIFRVMSASGAIAIGTIVATMSSTPKFRVLIWLALIIACDVALGLLTATLIKRSPPPETLQRWASIKGGVATLLGFVWSLGPILLYQPGEPITILATTWGLFMITAGIMYACALHPPTLYAMTTATIVPAVLFLGTRGDTLSTLAAICTATSLPFALGIGAFAVREVGNAISTRLHVAELLERQVSLSREVKAAHDARSRFFSAASHDLRQPLQALGFYMTLFSTAETQAKQNEMMSRMRECGDLLDRQFNAILGVAATDQAIEQATVQSIDLAPLLDRVRGSVAAEADLKGLEVRVVKTTARAQVAPEVLERVLVNLANNAVRYTQSGRVVIGVRRHGKELAIVIADTGIGIAPQDQPQIFDDFYQADNPERSRHKGFGLGLGIVRRLCEGMNWNVTLRSQRGKGSLFTVQIPRAQQETVGPSTTRDAELPAVATTNGEFGALSVLVVDDDALVRDATAALLRNWNVVHATAATSDEALAILAQQHDTRGWVVLLDNRLSDGDQGLEVESRISEHFGAGVKCIFLTGESDERFYVEAARRGLLVLRKPLKPIQVRAALMDAAIAARKSAA